MCYEVLSENKMTEKKENLENYILYNHKWMK